ncbi:hypothetical protein ACIBAG_38325 [Streptomyces sp. NPDC051243]
MPQLSEAGLLTLLTPLSQGGGELGCHYLLPWSAGLVVGLALAAQAEE